MANPTIGGLRFAYSLGSSDGPLTEVYTVPSNNTDAIFTGTVVKVNDAGGVVAAGAGDTDLIGVVQGVVQYWDGENMRSGNYLPAATVYGSNLSRQSKVRVIPFKNNVFEVDADAALATPTLAGAQAIVGSNGDITAESGNTVSGRSTQALDISTAETTDGSPGTAQLRIHGISKRIDQDFTASRVKFLVTVNEGFMPETDTAGV